MFLGDWHRLSLKSKLILGTDTGCVIENENDSWELEQAVIEIKIDSWGPAQVVSLKSKLILGDWHMLCH